MVREEKDDQQKSRSFSPHCSCSCGMRVVNLDNFARVAVTHQRQMRWAELLGRTLLNSLCYFTDIVTQLLRLSLR